MQKPGHPMARASPRGAMTTPARCGPWGDGEPSSQQQRGYSPALYSEVRDKEAFMSSGRGPGKENAQDEAYISVDIEAAGPVPGEYSMLSLGACLVDSPEITFY